MSRRRAGRPQECGFHSVQHTLPADDPRGGAARARGRASTPIRRSTASWCSCRCRAQIDADKVIEAIAPEKDVDGFHPVNAGRLAIGERRARSCPARRPARMILLRARLRELGLTLAGLEAVVVGRSNIVGKPMAQLLLAENCTVTIAHSRTRDLAGVVPRAPTSWSRRSAGRR